MEASHHPPTHTQVLQRIERSGERLWRHRDFRGLPSGAVAQALSRLARQGVLQRVGKGVYYRSRDTVFGKSRPNPAALTQLAANTRTVFPAGISAASLLGFTTQTPSRGEVATSGLSLPKMLIGETTKIHTRRPESWKQLSETEAALLDFIRERGKTTELSRKATAVRLLKLLAEDGRFEKLQQVANTEPPRVRALLGAIGEQLGKNPKILARLKESLNPLSRFDFGNLAELQYAEKWQVKGCKSSEAV